ncbi:MAG: DUF3025 domain-containing protein [Rhodocyclaceae bacterium]|nr:DUF3025 domain-containing protein [Rhodocyclaceae bacterium]MBX3670627.1 DUF3025 domain-containing protein [Rhodocyclaceae bacterium]
MDLPALFLYDHLRDLAAQLPPGAPPAVEQFDAAAERLGRPRGPSGLPIRFCSEVDPAPYEARIAQAGVVHTRADSWHDAFHALIWLAFPRAKAELTARHLRHDRGPGTARGALRDAAAQFDEDGVLVLCADAELAQLLQQRRWVEAFWDRRARMTTELRCVVFGHALLDKLRAPFFGLCGRALYVEIEPAVLACNPGELRNYCDTWLAAKLAGEDFLCTPRALAPLPLLGLPGMGANTRDYFLDTRQFRPPRT